MHRRTEPIDRHPPPRRPRSRRPENRPTIRLLQALDVCYARIYHRLTVRSPCRLPREGPGILVSNHISGLDPLLIQSVCPRLIVWMIAKEYYELSAVNWIFRQIGAIPVARSGRDVAATRQAMRVLHEGGVLGVFPEGRIETTRELLPFQTGVSLMAIRARVPVYPAYIDGTQRRQPMLAAFLRRQTARITFGAPLKLHREFSPEDLIGATFATRLAVQQLGSEPSDPHARRIASQKSLNSGSSC